MSLLPPTAELAILNVTHNGLSHDLDSPVHVTTSDENIKRIVAKDRGVPPETFQHFVVDRLESTTGRPKFYLRPKVPFGADPVVQDVLDAKREELYERIKDDALAALGHVSELQSLLIDLVGDPQYRPAAGVSERFLLVNDGVQELQGAIAALALLDAVQG